MEEQGLELGDFNIDAMKLYGYTKKSTIEGQRQRDAWLEEELKRLKEHESQSKTDLLAVT